MKLYYNECMHVGNIMKDFVRYDKVSEYLQGLLDATANNTRNFEMFPLDCAYKDISTGETMWILQHGQIHPDAQKNIDKLKERNAVFNNFISDVLVIKADGFERECFFSWN